MPNNDKEKNSGKKKTKKKGLKVLKVILITILIMFLAFVGITIGAIISIINGADGFDLSEFEVSELTTVIYDKDGNEFANLYNSENRMYASLSDISPYLPKAIIAIEDERFETHFGVDIKRSAAATFNYLLHGGKSDFGGSTITQQLIKQVTEDNSYSWKRKVREMVRAIQLERVLSKDQIIELYMNINYFGAGAYGVETASYTFFDKSAKDLTIAECALLASLPQAPSSYNPHENPDKAEARQKLVLMKMLELGSITKEQYDEAIAQELVYKMGALEASSSNSYYVDSIITELISDLQKELGVTKVMAQRMIYSNGLKIYSVVDPKIQDILEEQYLNQDLFKLSNGSYDPEVQSAMVVMDYKTGNVVGLMGGAGEKTVLRGLNRVYVPRQPGSTMKILGVYAPGIDAGIFTSATTFDDTPVSFKISSTTTWKPLNSYSGYRGLTSVRKAIEISSNIIAAKAFQEVGVQTSKEYLKKFGITTISNNDISGAALALGGLTNGISPMEHGGAYAAIANKGIYWKPKLYTKIEDKNGEVLFEKTSELTEVISEESAYILTSMMKDVITGSNATGSSANFSGMAIAGKTGTSNDSKDRWFVGYTPYYIASVWVGYDKPKVVSMTGNPAAKIWKATMSKIHEGLKYKDFEKPSGVISYQVCADSGLLPTDLCRNDPRGDRTITALFSKETIPKESCNIHALATVCKESNLLANPICIKESGTTEIVCLDRNYEEKPSVLPNDFQYEMPFDYCNLPEHYAEVDEYGNFITENYEDTDEKIEDDEVENDDEDNQENEPFWWEN